MVLCYIFLVTNLVCPPSFILNGKKVTYSLGHLQCSTLFGNRHQFMTKLHSFNFLRNFHWRKIKIIFMYCFHRIEQRNWQICYEVTKKSRHTKEHHFKRTFLGLKEAKYCPWKENCFIERKLWRHRTSIA